MRWGGTVFGINFGPALSQMPQPDDLFRVKFRRPLSDRDSLVFRVHAAEEVAANIAENMKQIKVVPNPYVMTNMMEPALMNPYLNQRRQLLFTHIPSRCAIKIFTSSGVLVDEMLVENSEENGTAHWDMLTKEGLEIAAGVYFFHVKSEVTGDEIMGKFAVLK